MLLFDDHFSSNDRTSYFCRSMSLVSSVTCFTKARMLNAHPSIAKLNINRCSKNYSLYAGMRSRDIFGRPRLRVRLRVSIPAPTPASAPSTTFRRLRLRLRLRLRAKCTGSGGSGSGSGSDAQILIWALTSNTIFKTSNIKIWPITDLTLSLIFLFVTHCHPRSVGDTGDGEVTYSLGLCCLNSGGYRISPRGGRPVMDWYLNAIE